MRLPRLPEGSLEMRSDNMESFLKRPNVAVLSWTTASGEAMSTPIWYQYRDGRFLMHTTYGTAKARAIERNDRVCLCIQDTAPPYRYVTVRGRAALLKEPERSLRLYEEMARAYYDRVGAGYYIRNMVRKMGGEHLIIEVTPTKISSLDATQAVHPLVMAVWRLLRRLPGLGVA